MQIYKITQKNVLWMMVTMINASLAKMMDNIAYP